MVSTKEYIYRVLSAKQHGFTHLQKNLLAYKIIGCKNVSELGYC